MNETKDKILELYREGKSVLEIAYTLGITPTTVYYHLSPKTKESIIKWNENHRELRKTYSSKWYNNNRKKILRRARFWYVYKMVQKEYRQHPNITMVAKIFELPENLVRLILSSSSAGEAWERASRFPHSFYLRKKSSQKGNQKGFK
jgi:predicted transcriptional regulator